MYDIHSPHARGDCSPTNGIRKKPYFNPLPSYEGRHYLCRMGCQGELISIHSPHTRGDVADTRTKRVWIISIHSPHTRGNRRPSRRSILPVHFNPLPSHEGRRLRTSTRRSASTFQSTPLMRVETKSQVKIGSPATFQSAPLMRGETSCGTRNRRRKINFNPLPSYEGRRTPSPDNPVPIVFQSTPLIRGETYPKRQSPCCPYFNPLPSCEGRPIFCTNQFGVSIISIHSPHARGDFLPPMHRPLCHYFNPLPSCEGRRAAKIGKKVAQTISIHSPHTRGDCPSPCRPSRRTYFNPLPSHEGRLNVSVLTLAHS